MAEERSDEKLVATESQWKSLLGLIDQLKTEKKLLKELLDEANEERYGNQGRSE